MTTTWRMFCAVELPQQVRAQLQDHIARLRKELPDAAASWSRVENIHLTLKFFGNVAVDRIGTVSSALDRAVKDFAAFEISVGGTGAFRNQVLWIGVGDPSQKLSDLNKGIENECATEGFEKEDRAYRPHLTIARIRRPAGAKRLAEVHRQTKFDPVIIHVNEIVLFRSELSPKGSKYTIMSSHRLDR